MTAAGQTISISAIGSNHPRTKPVKGQSPRSAGLYRAPWRDRTAYLLLTIYPRVHAVANCDDAGQVRGGPPCCRPTYLFIESGPVTAASTSVVTLRRRAHGRGCHRLRRS